MDLIAEYIGTVVALFSGILFVPIALPLKYRKIKKNYFYGFRLNYTMKDDDIWYEVNALLGRQVVQLGIFFFITGIVSIFLVKGRPAQMIFLFVITAILLAAVIYSLVTGIKLMNRMAIEKGLKEEK